MTNTIEAGVNVQKWTAGEHFKNPFATLKDRNQFTKRVADYIDLLRKAYPQRNEWEDSIIPLQGNDVSGADFPILTELLQGYQEEMHASSPEAKFSLAVVGSWDTDGYLLGIGAMKDGEYYGGLSFEPLSGNIGFSVSSIEGSSPASNQAFNKLWEQFPSGFTASQRKLQQADKLFKFIVSQTLEEIQDRFS